MNTLDAGFPIRGSIRLDVSANDPQMISPPVFWKARDVPKLYLRAAYHTRTSVAQLFWKTDDNPQFPPKNFIQFSVKPDGQIHTNEIDLSSSDRYRGDIVGLRFDPVLSGREGEYVEVISISWKRE